MSVRAVNGRTDTLISIPIDITVKGLNLSRGQSMIGSGVLAEITARDDPLIHYVIVADFEHVT